MRQTLLALPLVALTLVGAFTAKATAQETKKTRGTVTAMTESTVTVQVADTSMTFTVDDKTHVMARGAGTASAQAAAAGKSGPKLADVIKTGQAVEVSYQGTGGAMRATTIQAVAASAVAPPMNKSSNGKVTTVSAVSLTISGSSGAGATFTQTFVIDPKTKVTGRGVGTAAAKAGGRVPATDLVHTGDTVRVAFRDVNGTLHASSVSVSVKAAAK